MSGEDRSFNENLDLLIKLFKRLKDKASFDDMPGIDKTFYQNFEYLLSNYENMRDQLSEELLSKFGEPVKGMIASLVEQLKMELGDDIGDLDLDDEAKEEIEIPDDIAKIDEMLKKQDLTDEEVNKLLDERSRLVKNQPVDPNDILSNPDLG
ncbi:MAG: hypothetical protein V2I47_10580 [Bacteroidales bacterium]|jgi:hypothetical protein|nr:hypothetical protein [Bacteroidales bacterium]